MVKKFIMRKTPYLKSPILSSAHGFFTRQGGVSQGDFTSLNVNLDRGDKKECVLHNRNRIAETLDFKEIVWMKQTHSDIIHVIDTPPEETLFGDALIALKSGFLIAVQTADCVPLLFQGEFHVAAVHAGWRGALQNIVKKTMDQMKSLGNKKIHVAIGPHIHWHSYEVKEDVAKETGPWIIRKSHKAYLDLKQMIFTQLKGAEKVSVAKNNTYTDLDFFSCRRAFHNYDAPFGAQGSVIGIRNSL